MFCAQLISDGYIFDFDYLTRVFGSFTTVNACPIDGCCQKLKIKWKPEYESILTNESELKKMRRPRENPAPTSTVLSFYIEKDFYIVSDIIFSSIIIKHGCCPCGFNQLRFNVDENRVSIVGHDFMSTIREFLILKDWISQYEFYYQSKFKRTIPTLQHLSNQILHAYGIKNPYKQDIVDSHYIQKLFIVKIVFYKLVLFPAANTEWWNLKSSQKSAKYYDWNAFKNLKTYEHPTKHGGFCFCNPLWCHAHDFNIQLDYFYNDDWDDELGFVPSTNPKLIDWPSSNEILRPGHAIFEHTISRPNFYNTILINEFLHSIRCNTNTDDEYDYYHMKWMFYRPTQTFFIKGALQTLYDFLKKNS